MHKKGSVVIISIFNNNRAINYDNNSVNEKKYVMASGMMASNMEHVIWEQITGGSALSTVKVLEEALANTIEILMLSSANIDKEISRLNVSEGVLNDVKNAVASGKIVTIPKDKMTIGSWTGSGYIVMDPNTGAAGYMISGGIAGGVTDGKVTMAYMVNIGLSIWDMAQAILLINTALIALSAGSMLVGGITLVLGVVCLAFAIQMYYETIALMCAYISGDEEAGKQIIQNTLINVRITVGTTVLSAVAKPIIKTVLKNKLVREFGEEFVEKFIKQGDDRVDIGKNIKQLRKLGYSDDLIKKVVGETGQEGAAWIKKIAGRGLSEELIEKITKIPNYQNLSDEALNVLLLSKSNNMEIFWLPIF